MSNAETGDVEPRIARLENQEERLTRAVELLAQRATVPAGKPGRDWDALAAVIASFIGLLALAVSGYTAYVQREQLYAQSDQVRAQGEQLRAQVWPRLEISTFDNDAERSWHVFNQGTGPARVTAMRVMVGDALVTTWDGAEKAAGYRGAERTTKSSIIQSVLPAGKDVTIIRAIEDPPSRAKFGELLSGGKHALKLTICYCSVLNDCWVTTDQARPPIEPSSPDRCPIQPEEQFKD